MSLRITDLFCESGNKRMVLYDLTVTEWFYMSLTMVEWFL